MSSPWPCVPLSECISDCFAGEWGDTPKPSGFSKVIRATELSVDGSADFSGGVRRTIPSSIVAKKRLLTGDLVLEASGGSPDQPVGRVALFTNGDRNHPTLCSNFLRTLRPKSTVEPGYLRWQLHHRWLSPQILRFQQQTTGIINLKVGEYLQHAIPLPPLDEQRRIAAILDASEATIRATEAVVEKLRLEYKGLAVRLLEGTETSHGHWQINQIKDVCTDIVDCPHSTPVYRTTGVLVARTMHIKDGIFLESEASRVSEGDYRERIARLQPGPGDIVFTREAPVGESFVIPHGMRICLGQRVMLLRPNKAMVLPDFLHAQLYSNAVQRRISVLTAGTTNPHLNVPEVGALRIGVPPLSGQKSIVDALFSHKNAVKSECLHLEKLRLQHQGLLHDLLTGAVRTHA